MKNPGIPCVSWVFSFPFTGKYKYIFAFSWAAEGNETDFRDCFVHVTLLAMYIVAIAWLYVTMMMAITEPNLVGGILTFVFYGLLPCGLLLWLVGTPQRKRNKLRVISDQPLDQPDRTDPQHD